MSTFAVVGESTALRRAAVRATLAPSLCNTQPWRLRLRAGRLDVLADRERQLVVLDPVGRQLAIACGCALLNARASLAADGLAVDVQRLPDPTQPELLAALIPAEGSADAGLAELDPFAERRQSDRVPLAEGPVPPAVLDGLERAVAAEGATLQFVTGDEQRAAVVEVGRHADDIASLNPAYRAELRAWTTDRAAPWLSPLPAEDQTLAFLCTAEDTLVDWLRAGEALDRVLLESTRHGYVATPRSRLTEVPSARARLRDELELPGYPHLLVHIGRGPAGPPARRRRLVDLIVDET